MESAWDKSVFNINFRSTFICIGIMDKEDLLEV